MRIIRSLLLVLILLLFFTACSSASPKDDFTYTASSFTANVRGTYTSANGVPHPITARITVGDLLDRADPAARPITVVFTAPETLAGITVEAVYQTDTPLRAMATSTVLFSSSKLMLHIFFPMSELLKFTYDITSFLFLPTSSTLNTWWVAFTREYSCFLPGWVL